MRWQAWLTKWAELLRDIDVLLAVILGGSLGDLFSGGVNSNPKSNAYFVNQHPTLFWWIVVPFGLTFLIFFTLTVAADVAKARARK